MKIIWTALLIGFAFAQSARALDVYILRHAETMGNVSGDYCEENQRTFSPRGIEQVQAVPEKLANLHFDAILVSPTWRTQQTILPYLRATGRKAEIFPEITECDCGITGQETPANDPPRGRPIEIIEEGKDLFFIDPERPSAEYALRDKGEGLAVLQRAVELIHSRYGRTSASVLLVCHSCTGSRIIELLMGLAPRGSLAPGNTAVSRLQQQADGRFELLQYNDDPVTPFIRTLMFGFDPDLLPGFLDLAGTWRIASGDDPARAGAAFDDTGFLETRVPGGWEADALPDYDGIAWYRARFSLSDEQRSAWGTNALVLFMGAIDDADETFLNGRPIGASGEFSPIRTTAWDKPRVYPIEAGDLSDDNVLAVRVDDWGGGGGLWRGPVAIGPASTLNRLAEIRQNPGTE